MTVIEAVNLLEDAREHHKRYSNFLAFKQSAAIPIARETLRRLDLRFPESSLRKLTKFFDDIGKETCES